MPAATLRATATARSHASRHQPQYHHDPRHLSLWSSLGIGSRASASLLPDITQATATQIFLLSLAVLVSTGVLVRTLHPRFRYRVKLVRNSQVTTTSLAHPGPLSAKKKKAQSIAVKTIIQAQEAVSAGADSARSHAPETPTSPTSPSPSRRNSSAAAPPCFASTSTASVVSPFTALPSTTSTPTVSKSRAPSRGSVPPSLSPSTSIASDLSPSVAAAKRAKLKRGKTTPSPLIVASAASSAGSSPPVSPAGRSLRHVDASTVTAVVMADAVVQTRYPFLTLLAADAPQYNLRKGDEFFVYPELPPSPAPSRSPSPSPSLPPSPPRPPSPMARKEAAVQTVPTSRPSFAYNLHASFQTTPPVASPSSNLARSLNASPASQAQSLPGAIATPSPAPSPSPSASKSRRARTKMAAQAALHVVPGMPKPSPRSPSTAAVEDHDLLQSPSTASQRRPSFSTLSPTLSADERSDAPPRDRSIDPSSGTESSTSSKSRSVSRNGTKWPGARRGSRDAGLGMTSAHRLDTDDVPSDWSSGLGLEHVDSTGISALLDASSSASLASPQPSRPWGTHFPVDYGAPFTPDPPASDPPSRPSSRRSSTSISGSHAPVALPGHHALIVQQGPPPPSTLAAAAHAAQQTAQQAAQVQVHLQQQYAYAQYQHAVALQHLSHHAAAVAAAGTLHNGVNGSASPPSMRVGVPSYAAPGSASVNGGGTAWSSVPPSPSFAQSHQPSPTNSVFSPGAQSLASPVSPYAYQGPASYSMTNGTYGNYGGNGAVNGRTKQQQQPQQQQQQQQHPTTRSTDPRHSSPRMGNVEQMPAAATAPKGPSAPPPPPVSPMELTTTLRLKLTKAEMELDRFSRELEIARWRLAVSEEDRVTGEIENQEALAALAARARHAEARLKALESSRAELSPGSSSPGARPVTVAESPQEDVKLHPLTWVDLDTVAFNTHPAPRRQSVQSNNTRRRGGNRSSGGQPHGHASNPHNNDHRRRSSGNSRRRTPSHHSHQDDDDEDDLVIVLDAPFRRKMARPVSLHADDEREPVDEDECSFFDRDEPIGQAPVDRDVHSAYIGFLPAHLRSSHVVVTGPPSDKDAAQYVAERSPIPSLVVEVATPSPGHEEARHLGETSAEDEVEGDDTPQLGPSSPKT